MDEEERRERKLEADTLDQLEESGLEKMGEVAADADSELVLVGDAGPVPYENLLTSEEYDAFRELAAKSEPNQEEVARGQAFLRLMMKRYPEGPKSGS